jgi:hypothetical protein
MDRHAQGIMLRILSAIAYSSVGFFVRPWSGVARTVPLSNVTPHL